MTIDIGTEFVDNLRSGIDWTRPNAEDEYVSALERALEERMRVNVGLIAENTELKRRIQP